VKKKVVQLVGVQRGRERGAPTFFSVAPAGPKMELGYKIHFFNLFILIY